jgi:hypothetical protein
MGGGGGKENGRLQVVPPLLSTLDGWSRTRRSSSAFSCESQGVVVHPTPRSSFLPKSLQPEHPRNSNWFQLPAGNVALCKGAIPRDKCSESLRTVGGRTSTHSSPDSLSEGTQMEKRSTVGRSIRWSDETVGEGQEGRPSHGVSWTLRCLIATSPSPRAISSPSHSHVSPCRASCGYSLTLSTLREPQNEVSTFWWCPFPWRGAPSSPFASSWKGVTPACGFGVQE